MIQCKRSHQSQFIPTCNLESCCIWNEIFVTNYLKAHAAIGVSIDGIEYVMSILSCADCKVVEKAESKFPINFYSLSRWMTSMHNLIFPKIANSVPPDKAHIMTGFVQVCRIICILIVPLHLEYLPLQWLHGQGCWKFSRRILCTLHSGWKVLFFVLPNETTTCAHKFMFFLCCLKTTFGSLSRKFVGAIKVQKCFENNLKRASH